MACRDHAAITVTRGQLIAAFGAWNEDLVREGLAEKTGRDVASQQADYLMYQCRQQGAK